MSRPNFHVYSLTNQRHTVLYIGITNDIASILFGGPPKRAGEPPAPPGIAMPRSLVLAQQSIPQRGFRVSE